MRRDGDEREAQEADQGEAASVPQSWSDKDDGGGLSNVEFQPETQPGTRLPPDFKPSGPLDFFKLFFFFPMR